MARSASAISTKFQFTLEDERLAYAVRNFCFQNGQTLSQFFHQAAVGHLIDMKEIEMEDDLQRYDPPARR